MDDDTIALIAIAGIGLLALERPINTAVDTITRPVNMVLDEIESGSGWTSLSIWNIGDTADRAWESISGWFS